MIFQRFFLSFLAALAVAFMLLVALVHVFQKRIIFAEWREDLRQQAYWTALHYRGAGLEKLAAAWHMTHSTVRLSFFDAEKELVADSEPEQPALDLDALLTGRGSFGRIAAVEPLNDGGWVVMSRPWTPAFPSGLSWELVASAAVLVSLVAAFLYPMARSMSRTMRDLASSAEDVAAGHFGKTLDVKRSDELGALVQAFNDMSRKLAEAERLNTRLLHDVSHELRSPLGRIQVMAQTLARHPDEAEKHLADIEHEVALLDRLVGDLLEAARIETETLRTETFSLRTWSEETLRRLESEARARGVDWTARFPERDVEVRGDPQRLAQAVGNLVDNSVHALDSREDARIDVSLATNGERWSVTVEDNGPGIPEDDLPHVFRRFYRVGEHRDRDRGGVGLGLSLVRAITEAHGGSARVERRPEGGVRATLSLPVG